MPAPHRNAGQFAPAIATERRVCAMVLDDAGVWPTGGGEASVAPGELYEFLAAKVDSEGLLRPWTEWWSEDEVAPLFPDPEVRARIERQQRRLPLTYNRTPCAYLAFGSRRGRDRAGAPTRLAGCGCSMITNWS